ncbi:MAG: trypsin-like peptidase domain-containing protein, partial [Planctomycetes bacterium]|nr:trypsin-like peptidase domain-containing protein [Planctomycetota bacterium]
MAVLFSALIVLVATTEPSDLPPSIEARIQGATVRLIVHDENQIVYGSGTIVDVDGSTGTIVTCAHTFRHTQPGAPVEVTLFSNKGEEKLEGRLVSLNAESDVALVHVEGIRSVTPIPVALPGYEPSVGQEVV